MKKNDCVRMRGENLGANLEGVCHHEGLTVFVPGLLPGEEALIRILRVEKKYAFGKIETAPEQASPCRRTVDCPVFPRCGGCDGRHMTYQATLEAKRQQVADCLSRIGGIQAEVAPVLGMEQPFAYRNKTALPAASSKDGSVLGFYAPRSHTVIPMDSCPNAMAPANEIARVFRAWMREYQLVPYEETTGQGLIRHLVIRCNRVGESMVTVVAAGASLPHSSSLMERLKPLGVISLWLNENRMRNNVILSDRFHLLYGAETLTDTLCGLTFALSPSSFYQVNPIQTEKLYQTALDFAAPTSGDLLCDVYCGAGTIGLSMAHRCSRIIGIEIVPAAIRNAEENARRNHIQNASFYTGKAEEILPRLVSDGLRPDIIVIDPPRKGVEPPVVDAIAKAGPSRVVYVSCNPATLARDAALLQAAGYAVKKVQPVDLFCWTSGIETVCLLSRS